jgi:eukaryotic-like serine/threonine-protein kinase
MSMSQVGSGLPRLLAERYELAEQLASGGMTSVWRGHDRVLGRDVVVKVLHPELAADEDFRVRFHEEAVNAARLTHPNIVALYDTGEQGGIAYIVMELVHGSTLREALARNGPLPPAQAAWLATEVTAALGYAHQTGVCHGSLKPGNILLADDGTVKVADFSIARAATDDDPGRTGEILGADGYLAPEVVHGGVADGRADVYGLGACLYEMLTGRPPAADPAATVPPRALRAGVPRELDTVVQKAMAVDPNERFQSPEAMASALARSAATAGAVPTGGGLVEPLEAPPRSEGPPARGFLRHEGRWLGWTLALVVLVGVLAVALTLASDTIGDLFGGDGSPGPADSTGTTTGQTAVRVVQATPFDPPPGDGQESDDEAANAIDRDPATAWKTEGYKQPNLGGLKPGVGLVLDLGEPQPTRQLTVTLSAPGATMAVYGSDDRPPSLDGWTELGGSQTATGQRVSFDLGGQPHRYLLVWFTSLPRDDDGKFRGGIAAVTLRS